MLRRIFISHLNLKANVNDWMWLWSTVQYFTYTLLGKSSNRFLHIGYERERKRFLKRVSAVCHVAVCVYTLRYISCMMRLKKKLCASGVQRVIYMIFSCTAVWPNSSLQLYNVCSCVALWYDSVLQLYVIWFSCIAVYMIQFYSCITWFRCTCSWYKENQNERGKYRLVDYNFNLTYKGKRISHVVHPFQACDSPCRGYYLLDWYYFN